MRRQGEDTDSSASGSSGTGSLESSDGTEYSSTDDACSSDEEEGAERAVDEQQIAEDEEDLNRLLGGGSMRVMTQALGRLTTRVSAQARQSVGNALRSIALDTQALLPLLVHYGSIRGYYVCANLRNGPWYVDPLMLATQGVQHTGQCYFKSTDGHVGNWSLNPTRLNLHLALQAATHRGAVVVDSTRRGKSFPDSLAFTLPLWCHVINTALPNHHHTTNTQPQEEKKGPSHNHHKEEDSTQPASSQWDKANDDKDNDREGDREGEGGNVRAPPSLVLPPWVPPSHAHRAACVVAEGQWVRVLEEAWAHNPLTPQLLTALSHTPSGVPLRLVPYWIKPWEWTPQDYASATTREAGARGEIPILCVTASPPTQAHEHRQHHSWGYVQGAGDDEEHWAQGLTPPLFHTHKEWLLQVADNETQLRHRVHMLVNGQGNAREEEEEAASSTPLPPLTQVGGTDVWVGGGGEEGSLRVGGLSLKVMDGSKWRDHILPTALTQYVSHRRSSSSSSSSSSPDPFVCRCGSRGGGEGLVVALAVLCAFYRGPFFADGPYLPPAPPPSLSLTPNSVLWWPLPVLSKECLRTRLIALQSLLPPQPLPPPRRLMKQLHKLFEDHRKHTHGHCQGGRRQER